MNWRAVTPIVLALASAGAPQSPQTFRARIEGVSVAVSVHDGRRGVRGLRAQDFELQDNGVPQTVASLSIEATPIDLTIVLDTSSSMSRDMLARLVEDAHTVADLLGPEDRAGLMTFSTNVRTVWPLHTPGETAPTASLSPAGTTAFYHAVAAALLAEAAPGRPHLALVMSDGADNISLLDVHDVRELARRSETVLYLILRGRPRSSGPHVGWLPFRGPGAIDGLKAAAAETGGDVRQESGDHPVASIFRSAIDDFKTGYVLRYTPHNVDPAGWHELSVAVPGHPYAVRARRGYFGG
jgi:VWFA-related protein